MADTWLHTANPNWSTGSNWADGTEPASTSEPVLFPVPPGFFSPAVTLSAGEVCGTLTFNVGMTLGGVGGTLNVGAAGGPISVAAGADTTINSNLNGTHGLTKSGLGMLSLGGANTYTGGVNINAGTLSINADSRLGNNGNAITISGGTLRTTANISTLRAISFGAAGGTVDISSGTLTLGSPLAGSSGALTSNGVGTLQLNAASTRTGTTDILNGKVRMAVAGALGSGAVTVGNFATLQFPGIVTSQSLTLNNNSTLLAESGSSTWSGSVTAAASSGVTLTPLIGATITLSNYGGGSGTTTSLGSNGTVFLPNASAYAGEWVVTSGGTLRLGHADASGTSSSSINVLNGSTLHLQSPVAGSLIFPRGIILHDGATLRGSPNSGDVPQATGQVQVASGAAVKFGGVSADFIIIGDGPNDLTGGGAGSTITIPAITTATLNAASDYTGDWIITGGALHVSDDAQLGNPLNNLSLSSGARLRVTAPVTTSRQLNMAGGTVTLTGMLTLNGGMAGSAATSLMIESASTVTLNAGGTWNGALVTVRGGSTLKLNHAAAVGATPIHIGTLSSTSTLELGAAVTLDQPITLSTPSRFRGNLNSASTGTVTVSPGANVQLSTVAADDVFTIGDSPNDLTGGNSATITVNGPGRVVLAQPSNYAGAWVLQAGTLEVAAGSHFGTGTSAITLDGGRLLTGNALSLLRGVSLDAAGGTVSTNGFDSTFGNVSGVGTLVKADTGNLAVNHLRTFQVALNAGSVTVEPDGTSAGTSKLAELVMAAGTTLDLADNKLIVTGDAVGTASGGVYSNLSGRIQSGRNGGTWNGSGIITSNPDAATGLTSLGIASADDVGYVGNTFGGLTVNTGDVLIMYTYAGDANLDGTINIDDYGRIDANVAQSGSVFGWYNGDFNYDGSINIDDYGIIDGNISQQGAPFPTNSQSLNSMTAGVAEPLAAVPEPSMMTRLFASLTCVMRRARGTR